MSDLKKIVLEIDLASINDNFKLYQSIFTQFPHLISNKFDIIELLLKGYSNSFSSILISLVALCKARLTNKTGQLYISFLQPTATTNTNNNFEQVKRDIHNFDFVEIHHHLLNKDEILIMECGHIHILHSLPCCSGAVEEKLSSREQAIQVYEKAIWIHAEKSRDLVLKWQKLVPSVTVYSRPMNDSIWHITYSYLHALTGISDGKLKMGSALRRPQLIPKEPGPNQVVTLTFSHLRFWNQVTGAPRYFVECNTEQICNTTLKEGRFANLLKWLNGPKSFLIDYSASNVGYLQHAHHPVTKIQLFPYYPSLALQSFSKSTTTLQSCQYDVTFLGAKSQRRLNVAEQCRKLGLRVFYPDSKANMSLQEQINIYSNSKLVLNIHWAQDSTILELARFIPAILAQRCIVTETSDFLDGLDTLCQLPGVFMCHANQIAHLCLFLCKTVGDTELLNLAKLNTGKYMEGSYNLESFLRTFPELALSSPNWQNIGKFPDDSIAQYQSGKVSNQKPPAAITKPKIVKKSLSVSSKAQIQKLKKMKKH